MSIWIESNKNKTSLQKEKTTIIELEGATMRARSDSGSLPTTSAHIARLRIFQPTRSPKTTEGEWIPTPWGRARVAGALGQRHADVLEIMMKTARGSWKDPGGRLCLLIDPHKARTGLSPGGQYSSTGLDRLVNDLRNADVEWEMKGGRRGGVSKIVSDQDWASVTAPDPLRPRQERRLWKITLSAPWVALLTDLGLRYDPANIVQMRHGVSQAATRVLLGHNRHYWPAAGLTIDTVLDWVGVPAHGQARWDARRRIKDDTKYVESYGLRVENGRILDTKTLARTPDTLAPTPDTLARTPDTLARTPDFPPRL